MKVGKNQNNRRKSLLQARQKQERELDLHKEDKMAGKKVSFQEGGMALSEYSNHINKEDLKNLWYTTEKLQASRDEAKVAVAVLIHIGLDALNDDSSSGVCFRGIEKYHHGIRDMLRNQNLVKIILLQQSINRQTGITGDSEQLASISRELSKLATDFAHVSAQMYSSVDSSDGFFSTKKRCISSDSFIEGECLRGKRAKHEQVVCSAA
jgi:hypothetical protein